MTLLHLLPVLDSPLAVVPIFVNAGAAILPAIVAGLASMVTLLLKPKELIAACRRSPGRAFGTLGGLLAAGFLIYWAWGFFTKPAPTARAAVQTGVASPGSQTDWAKVALEIIRKEERAKVLGTAGALPSASTPPAPASTLATIFRHGAARTGHDGGPSPTSLAPLWEYAEDATMYLSSPLVANGRVYGGSCLLDPPSSYGSVFCLDAEDGKVIWKTDVKEPGTQKDFKGIFSSPALTADGKYLLIGQGLHNDFQSELVCLDAATGRVLWLLPTPLHVESSPAIDGDLVVVGAGSVEVGDDHKPKGNPEAEGHPGMVYGVRISDGKLLWKHQVNDPESSPVIVEGVAYIGSGVNGNAVVALRTESDEELKSKGLKRELWRAQTPFPAVGAITVAGDLVLMGCGNGDFVFASPNPEGAVLALDRASGKELWRVKLPDVVLGAVAVHDGVAVCGVRNGEVFALDLKKAEGGRILWHTPVNEISALLASPAFTGTHVYAGSQDGWLAVIDAATGKVLEKHYLNAPNKPGEMGLSASSPFVAGGRVYVGSETGGVRCFVGKAQP
jgi:outer membrane protein assembly factor BamB